MSDKEKSEKQTKPGQTQSQQPGHEDEMHPKPEFDDPNYVGSGKLKDKVVLITGGDSGIGRAICVLFAKEGANIVFTYLNEHDDAAATKKLIEAQGQSCLAIAGNITDYSFCEDIVKKTIQSFKKIDVLINNAAVQFPKDKFEEITIEQIELTFKTNIFSYLYMVKVSLPHMKEGSCIINTASITAYKGHAELVDYSATKGAIVTFTRSLSQNLVKRGIRVNGVAPGPIWTPLIPASFSKDKVKHFGGDVPMGRPGEPREIAPAYLFLATTASSYMTGQILHPNGGEIVNG